MTPQQVQKQAPQIHIEADTPPQQDLPIARGEKLTRWSQNRSKSFENWPLIQDGESQNLLQGALKEVKVA